MTYNDQIPFVVNQNPDVNIIIQVTGKGSEPQIIFDRTMVEFDPVLPFSEGSEAEVTITNPMDYPLEIYSLEFDNQYLDEEDVSTMDYVQCTCIKDCMSMLFTCTCIIDYFRCCVG